MDKRIKKEIKEYKYIIRMAAILQRGCISAFMKEKDPEEAKELINNIKKLAEVKVKCKKRIEIMKKMGSMIKSGYTEEEVEEIKKLIDVSMLSDAFQKGEKR